MADVVWNKTIEELDKGFCDGPFSAADLDTRYGMHRWRAARRFGISQNGAIRV